MVVSLCLMRKKQKNHPADLKQQHLLAEIFKRKPELLTALDEARGACPTFQGCNRNCNKGGRCPYLHVPYGQELAKATNRFRAPFLQVTGEDKLLVQPPLKKAVKWWWKHTLGQTTSCPIIAADVLREDNSQVVLLTFSKPLPSAFAQDSVTKSWMPTTGGHVLNSSSTKIVEHVEYDTFCTFLSDAFVKIPDEHPYTQSLHRALFKIAEAQWQQKEEGDLSGTSVPGPAGGDDRPPTATAARSDALEQAQEQVVLAASAAASAAPPPKAQGASKSREPPTVWTDTGPWQPTGRGLGATATPQADPLPPPGSLTLAGFASADASTDYQHKDPDITYKKDKLQPQELPRPPEVAPETSSTSSSLPWHSLPSAWGGGITRAERVAQISAEFMKAAEERARLNRSSSSSGSE